MQHCIITPTKYINDPGIGGQSDFLLVLSHLLDADCNNEYAQQVQKFKKSGKRLYLDNGLFENHSPEDPKSLLSKAIKIGADYVFAPDHLYNRKRTEEAFGEFAALAAETDYQGELAYVVQADNEIDYIASYKWALNNPQIGLIGISILSVPKSFGGEITESRARAIQLLDIYLSPKKPAHMLGLGGGLQDLIVARDYPWIISNDSCSAYMSGFYKREYDENYNVPGGKVEEKVQFDYDGELSTTQRDCITKNIAILRNEIL